MAKIKNKTFRTDDRDYLQILATELDFIGRPYRLNLKEGYITQYVRPQLNRKKPVDKERRVSKPKKEFDND